MTAFVLRSRKELPPDDAPQAGEVYEPNQQLWVDIETHVPVVNILRAKIDPTRFGETLLTATREGADQSEVSALQGTQFGETTMTKTFEGTDQGEIAALEASTFGETVITRTHEGIDQPEISITSDARDLSGAANPHDRVNTLVPPDAAYSHF
jgi:hypothetical protein